MVIASGEGEKNIPSCGNSPPRPQKISHVATMSPYLFKTPLMSSKANIEQAVSL